MARCPNCLADIRDDVRFCPECGAEQPRRSSPQDHPPPLPLSPWGPPPLATEPAGSAAGRAEPVVGPPLSGRQVTIAVGGILLFIALFLLIGHRGVRRTASGSIPVKGMMGEEVTIGDTAWGVAFTDQIDRIDNHPPTRGQFYTVGVVLGNNGKTPIRLSRASVGLLDGANAMRYTPELTAWGTPDELKVGRYRTEFVLPPKRAIAGLVVFDAPTGLAKPRLLVRDLASSSAQFTGAIDLTQEKNGKGSLNQDAAPDTL